MTREEAQQYRKKVIDGEKVSEMGGFSTSIAQSDKLGFDWEITSLNGTEIVKKYIKQENPMGNSADNPIVYTDGMPLINNAFYSIDGKVKVWMGIWIDWD